MMLSHGETNNVLKPQYLVLQMQSIDVRRMETWSWVGVGMLLLRLRSAGLCASAAQRIPAFPECQEARKHGVRSQDDDNEFLNALDG
eukprot:4098212-Amphidinium_carterae.2